jgi:hypothetical protein
MSVFMPTPEVDPVTASIPDAAIVAPDVPSVKEVRANFDERARAKSTFKGVMLFIGSMAPYLLGYWAFVELHGWWLKIASAAVFTVAIPMLFIIGHDACHQALTPHGWLNKILGRLAMLPGWHAYAVWDYGHNALHHGWTNLRTRDLVWVPLTKDEYDALSPLGRLLQRLYRTGWGVGLYYMVEMWAKFGMSRAKVKAAPRKPRVLGGSILRRRVRDPAVLRRAETDRSQRARVELNRRFDRAGHAWHYPPVPRVELVDGLRRLPAPHASEGAVVRQRGRLDVLRGAGAVGRARGAAAPDRADSPQHHGAHRTPC